MSAISLKSITGITSITTPAGVDNQLTLHTNDTSEKLRIASDGKIGINTTTPDTQLEVFGGTTSIQVGNQSGLGRFGADGTATKIGSHSNHPLDLFTNGVANTRLRITTDGKFSLGTLNATPSAAVHIDYDSNNMLMLDNSSASTQKIFFAQNAATHAQIYATSAAGSLIFDSDPSNNHNTSIIGFNIDGSAKLQIGSSGNFTFYNNTAVWNTIQRATATHYVGLRIQETDGTQRMQFGVAGGANNIVNGAAQHDVVLKAYAANLLLATNSTERFRIDSNGRIGLGINNPGDYFSSYNRVVMGRTNDTGGMTIVSAPTSGGYIAFADGTSGNQAYRGLIAYHHSSDSMRFSTDADSPTIVLDNAKRVGIGTDIMDSSAEVSITNATSSARVYMKSADNADCSIYFGSMNDAATGAIRYDHSDDSLRLYGYNNSEKFRIASDGKIGMGGATSPEELLDLGNALQINLKVGGRAYLGQGYSTAATILGHSVKAKTTGTVSGGMEVTETNSGGGAPAAIRMQSGRIEFHTAASGTSGATFDSEKLRITTTGRAIFTSDNGIFIKPATDSVDAKISFSTNNNNGNTQIGHIKYNHQDDAILSNYGEGMIMGGTESNGFILRVDGAINIKDSDSAGGDGAKLLFGTDKDMRMYHSGGDGFIDGTGTGGLRIRYNDIIISNYNSSGTRRCRFQSDQGIEVFSVTNGQPNGARIQFSDASDQSQIGTIKYAHSNNAIVDDGTEECFVIEGTEGQTALKLDGRFYMSDDKFVMKPTFSNFNDIPNGTSTSTQGVMMRCDGSQASAGNSGVMSNNAYEPFIANRTGNDGTLIRLRHQSNTEGEIKVNGSSVTYGNFMGSHKAQFVDHSKPDLLIGTVMEAVDQIATWKYASFSVGVGTDATTKFIPYYGSKNDGETDTITFESNTYNATIKNYRDPMPEITKHVCVKVSDTVGSKAVFGVFNCWQEENVVERESSNTEYAWNDLDVASIGNYFIRMQSGQTPEVGDYVESAGDGTAKVQSDDILRSKTIAKITSLTKQKTYSDGSFLVTCTLHCG